MEPGKPRSVRLVVFFFMCLVALWNFFANVAARYKEHPLDSIYGFPLWALNIITTAVFVACTVLYIGLTWHYAKENPYWSVWSLGLALAMTGTMIWAGLDLFDWFVWGPLVVVLAIIVRAGLEEVANSVQSGMLRRTWNGFWGYEPLPPPPPQPQTQDPAHILPPDLEGGHELEDLPARPSNNG